jgi:hypothetical protein
MKLNIKTAGAAIALVVVSNGAFAALNLPSATNGSDLTLNIWDNDNSDSGFTQDLGVQVGTFNAADPYSITITNAGVLAAFNSNSQGTFWDINAATSGSAGAGTYDISNQVNTLSSPLDSGNQIDQAVGGENVAYQAFRSLSGQTFSTSSTGYASSSGTSTYWAATTATGSGNLNEQDTQFADSTGTSTSSQLYFDQLTTPNGTASSETVFNGYWTLTFNNPGGESASGGTAGSATSATLTWTPTPVPLPAAVWLLGSGLLGLAGIGRRRSASAAAAA